MKAAPLAGTPARPAAERSEDGTRGGRVPRLKRRLREFAQAALEPVAALAHGAGLRANHVSVLGLVLCAGSGLSFFDGHSRLGALLLLLAGTCDVLDGQMARRAGGETPFGAFFDSTLDRLSEALVLVGILGFCLRNLVALVFEPTHVVEQMAWGLDPVTWAVVAGTAALALVGSFMVSYTRARAEGLGLECRVGWFERPERMLLLVAAGALKVFWAMSGALMLLTVLSFFTAAQRVAHVWKHTRGAGPDR